jgi:hypothetical protein
MDGNITIWVFPIILTIFIGMFIVPFVGFFISQLSTKSKRPSTLNNVPKKESVTRYIFTQPTTDNIQVPQIATKPTIKERRLHNSL